MFMVQFIDSESKTDVLYFKEQIEIVLSDVFADVICAQF